MPKDRILGIDTQVQNVKDTLVLHSDPVPDPPPPVTTFQLYRRFIHGLDYIDELVAQVTPNGDRRYIIQDVNHNVRALVNGCTQEIMRQYRYSPYGDFDRNIVGTVNGLEDYDGSTVALDDRESFHGFQGLWSDATLADPATQSTGFYWTRTRIVRPMWERMMQRDYNGQGLTIGSLLAMNGSSQPIFASVSPGGQYGDGMSLYQSFSGDPLNGTDPTGMFTFVELAGVQALRSDLMSLEYDSSASLVDSLKGLSLLAYERNAAMDDFLGTQSSPFDFSGIDRALNVYHGYQTAQLGIFGAVVTGKLIGAGAKLWRRFVSRAGSRWSLLNILDGGINRVRRFFGFGRKSLPWQSWDQYPKTTYKSKTYAVIGSRYYSRHAVDRMQPSGLGHAAGASLEAGEGRSIAPAYVEDVIQTGTKRSVTTSEGIQRIEHTSGTVQVITEENELIVVTINPWGG